MTQTLIPRSSPLEQVRRLSRVPLADPARQLSQRDQAMLKLILINKCDYVANALFESRGAEKKIFDEAPPISRRDSSWYHPVMENIGTPRAGNGSGTDRLTNAQESALFLQFNYCRYKVAQICKQIGDAPVDLADAVQILTWHRKAEDYRDQIAQANLALVLAMAKRTYASEVDFGDLVSEGNMALLRATDKFDTGRGFKFSTYACRAILKAFSRTAVKLTRHRRVFPTDFDPKHERSNFMEKKRETHEDDFAEEIHLIIRENRAHLTDIEGEVLQHRFGVGQENNNGSKAKPMTLDQAGKIIGVTKERVRQIQNKALEKIRLTLEKGFLN